MWSKYYRIILWLIPLSPIIELPTIAMSTEPPGDFGTLEICSRYSQYSCTLQEFSQKAFMDGAHVTWEKNEKTWILKASLRDKLTGKPSQVAIEFARVSSESGPLADVVRMAVNHDAISDALVPNFMTPFAEVAGQKTGRPSRSILQQKQMEKDHENNKGNLISLASGRYQEVDGPPGTLKVEKTSESSVKVDLNLPCGQPAGGPFLSYEGIEIKLKRRSVLFNTPQQQYTDSSGFKGKYKDDKCTFFFSILNPSGGSSPYVAIEMDTSTCCERIGMNGILLKKMSAQAQNFK